MMDHQFTLYAEHAVDLPVGPEELHGHDWNITITVESSISKTMVRERLQSTLNQFSDTNLNENPQLSPFGASAESFARVLFEQCQQSLADSETTITMVTVEEEPGCWARYWHEEEKINA